MNKCIFSWFGFVLPLQERLILIKDTGFDATCLWWEDEVYPKTIPVDHMPAMVKDAGLFLDNIHCPYMGADRFWSESKSARQREIDTYYSYIEACAKHEIPHMIMHVNDEDPVIESTALGLDSMIHLVRRAEEYGVKLVIENTLNNDIIHMLLSEIPSKNLGLCYDSSHDWIQGQSYGDLLEKWKNRLYCTHLSDNNGKEDKHWIPGDGEVCWKKIIPNIINSQIDSITMELLSSKIKIEDPKEYLKTAYDSLEQIIKC